MDDNNKEKIINKQMLNIISLNDEDSPKNNCSNNEKDFTNINIIGNDNESEYDYKKKKMSICSDLVNIILDNNDNDNNDNDNDNDNDKIIIPLNKKIEDLLLIIKNNKKKIINNLYIISSKYDILYYRYNNISLAILILSTIITFIEAIRLTLINYDNTYDESSISLVISTDTISLIINILSLSVSTILTVLSSIAKFKNYKENMDKLKNIHDTLFNYKNLYDKQKELINFFKTSNELTENIYKEIHNTIQTYNKEIKAISIFENIRNTDIIKFNKIKACQDIKLQQILKGREIRLLEINTLAKNKKENIGKETPNCCTNIIPL
jgi:hypothetical protein